MKTKPLPYPDLIPKTQIQAYIQRRTGTLVSKQRIGAWVVRGEIPMIQRPVRYGGGWFTRKLYLDRLIDRYSA